MVGLDIKPSLTTLLAERNRVPHCVASWLLMNKMGFALAINYIGVCVLTFVSIWYRYSSTNAVDQTEMVFWMIRVADLIDNRCVSRLSVK